MDKKVGIHSLILWSKVSSYRELIVKDLEDNFEIVSVNEFTWEKKLFFKNLKKFYSHSLKKYNSKELEYILKNKIIQCGDKPFVVIVFKDYKPKYEFRNTSDGLSMVNTNVYDKKQYYRDLVGGGHSIHTSNNEFETNKDIALLFGYSSDEFVNYGGSLNFKTKLKRNITGVPHWESLSQMFFILNNSLKYVVLRNFECFPDQYHLESHGDIDLLVEDLNFVVYLLDGEKVFQENYRVHYYVNIGGDEIPFDFRFIGDKYYDNLWELDIIEKRVLYKNFYIPNNDNYFYSLVYHAYIHKFKPSADYILRLTDLSKQNNMCFEPSDSKVIDLLQEYFLKKDYTFVVPEDNSVYFNYSLVKSIKQKPLLTSSITKIDNKTLVTNVIDSGTHITKLASNPICQNEFFFLTKLNNISLFPNVIEYVEIEKYISKCKIQKYTHTPFDNIYSYNFFLIVKSIKSLYLDAVNIVLCLKENNISHRDIRPDNLLIVNENSLLKLKLIDFGWATKLNNNDKNNYPSKLGGHYKWDGAGFSDAYSFSKSLNSKFSRIPDVNNILKSLSLIEPNDYLTQNKFINLKLINLNENKITSISRIMILFLLFSKYRYKKTVLEMKLILNKIKDSFNYRVLGKGGVFIVRLKDSFNFRIKERILKKIK